MDLNLQQRAVLGAFLFYPDWSAYAKAGMRPSHILQTAPKTFQSMFAGASDFNIKHNRGMLPAHIARICRGLCDLGLMYKVGSVKARYLSAHGRDTQLQEYESPLFAPTEVGMQYLLCVFDWSALPKFPKQKNRRYERDAARATLELASGYRDQFELFIQYDHQEAYKAKFKRARRCAH
jgi:hypothetical protein